MAFAQTQAQTLANILALLDQLQELFQRVQKNGLGTAESAMLSAIVNNVTALIAE